jgi:hypothetical protein
VVQVAARRQVLSAGVHGSAERGPQALEETRPGLEHRVVEARAQVPRLSQDAIRLGEFAQRPGELARRDLRLDPVAVLVVAAVEQKRSQASAVGLAKAEEQIAGGAHHPGSCAGIRIHRPLQGHAHVFVVVVQLVHEPLPAGDPPFLTRHVGE